MRIQNNRVEELKSKISELEEVLKGEKTERDAVFSRVEQIRELESQVEKERQEKEFALARLRMIENNEELDGSTIHNEDTADEKDAKEGVEDDAETETDAESRRHSKRHSSSKRNSDTVKIYYESRINELEGRITELLNAAKKAEGEETPDENKMLELHTEISFLKGDNTALKKEKDYYQERMKSRDEELRKYKGHNHTLESELTDIKSKLDLAQTEANDSKEKCTAVEKQLSAKQIFIDEKLSELETTSSTLQETEQKLTELQTKHREDANKLEEVTAELEKIKNERDELNRQVQGFQTSRRHLDKQVAALERDNRRGKRLITALETSLQDLKISLEEKAMENDELNRSILKVMEQANETIEGAKRNSSMFSKDGSSFSSPDLSNPESSKRVSSSSTFSNSLPLRASMCSSSNGSDNDQRYSRISSASDGF